MNLVDRARAAYAPAHSPSRTARSAEHQVLADVTAKLRTAAADPGDFPTLAAALSDNRRLWTRLAADVADDRNALSVQLRAQIFYLGEFVQHHSSRVLRGEADAAALIEINTAVMRGLSGQPAQPEGVH